MNIWANDPRLKTWLEVPAGSDFPIQNIPFGIFSTKGTQPRAATRIGDTVIDLAILAEEGYFNDLGIDDLRVFSKPYLNDLIACGRPVWRALRDQISELFEARSHEIQENSQMITRMLIPTDQATMHMPVKVGNYTDFYSNIEHAINVGKMFRDPANALLPNWRHIPVGYHGRASSIVVSGTMVHRPKGQTKADDAAFPAFGPTRQLDFELEMAFITGRQTELGTSIPVENAEEHIFGLVMFNDLSARDIQKWEYVPLGPFLGKNFASIVSPWIITLDALEPFRVKGPVQEPPVLPYLQFEGDKNYDINLEVFIQPDKQEPFRVCRSNFRYMYWNMCQQLAHHTVNGCNIQVGDMYASGTISGPDEGSYGSMLELAWKGTRPLQLPDGTQRTFIEDNDTIILKGFAEKNGVRIGFGEAVTKILPVR